jgi:hypothetical protein
MTLQDTTHALATLFFLLIVPLLFGLQNFKQLLPCEISSMNVMQLLEELLSFLGIQIPVTAPTVHCKVFEDNVGAIKLIEAPKSCP